MSAALQRIQARSPELHVLPTPTEATSLQSWVSFVREAPVRWQSVLRACSKLRPVVAPAEAATRTKAIEPHICPECQREFDEPSKLGSHRYRIHGVKNPIRLYCRTTACLVCARDFHERERIINHLQARKSCQQYYLDNVTPMTSQEAEKLDKAARVSLKDRVSSRVPARPYVSVVNEDHFWDLGVVEGCPEAIPAGHPHAAG